MLLVSQALYVCESLVFQLHGKMCFRHVFVEGFLSGLSASAVGN